MGRSLSGGVETVHWASLDEWGSELPGGRDAGVGGLWAGLEGLCGPEGGWSAGPRAYSPASRAFLSPDPEAPDASDPATAAAYAYAGGSPLSMVDPSGGRATPAQGGWDEQSWRATQARRAVAAGVRDAAEFAGILDRHTESYSELVCGVIARGQRTTYTVNPHGVLNVAGMIPGPVGFAADIANTGLYVWEGDWAGAGMSAAPRVFDIFRAGRAASSSTRFASRGDDMARAATRGEGFASRTWSRAKSAFRSFRDEVGDFAREVAGSESGGIPDLGKKLGISEEKLAAWKKKQFDEWLNRGTKDTRVYFGKMGEEVRYVGITRQDLDKRLAQHWLTGRCFDELPPVYGDKLFTRHQAKALEQYNINAYGGARAHGGETLMNIIDSIGKRNKHREQALAWAEEYERNGGA